MKIWPSVSASTRDGFRYISGRYGYQTIAPAPVGTPFGQDDIALELKSVGGIYMQ
jgi:hypothetical protein